MAPRLKNEFSWSKSRDETFRECLRKYYFQYYGAWGGWERGAPERPRRLYTLKKLQTRWMWAGDHVHRAVQAVLADLRQGRPPPAADAAGQPLLEALRREFRDSRDGRYRQDPVRACGLFEHEYQVELSDEDWKGVADHAGRCLQAFLASEIFQTIRALPPGAWLELEQLASFVLDGLKIFVQLDFACRRDDGVRIYDWKTGRGEADGSDVQTGCYLLYGRARWQAPPDQLAAVVFNLATGAVRERRLDAAQLDDLRGYILDSADEMLVPLEDPEKNLAREEAFDFAEDESACRRCNFLKACPRWQ